MPEITICPECGDSHWADRQCPTCAKLAPPPRDATMVPRPIEEWHEDHGDVLWWCWRDGAWLGEAPYVGSPVDLGHTVECHTHTQNGDSPAARFMVGGWPGYHTHWTPLPVQPYAPDQS